MNGMTMVVGIIAVIVILSIVVAAYPPIMGSVAADAQANNITGNATLNLTYQQGTAVAQGFMGFNQAEVAILFIILIICVWLLIFKL
jgi:hypothetical protein